MASTAAFTRSAISDWLTMTLLGLWPPRFEETWSSICTAAALIISVTNAFKTELIGRGIPEEKIQVVVNGVDQGIYQAREKDPHLLEKYKLNGKFVAGYIGTIGLAHGLESIVTAAEMIRDEDDYVFLVAGGGAESGSIRQLIADKALTNVRFLGRQDKELMPTIWSLCDVSIVHLKDTPLFSKVIPSKIFECFAMGLPIVLGLPEGEASQIVKATETGMVVRPESPQEIVTALRRLHYDDELRSRFSNNGLKAADKYSRDKKALEMLATLEELIY